MKKIMLNFGLMSCLSQMILISIITIAIIEILKIWYKPKNTKKYEWLTIVISFTLQLIADILLCVFFKSNIHPTEIFQEVLYIFFCPVLAKLMYDTYKDLVKGGKDDKRNNTYTSIQTSVSDNTNNQA